MVVVPEAKEPLMPRARLKSGPVVGVRMASCHRAAKQSALPPSKRLVRGRTTAAARAPPAEKLPLHTCQALRSNLSAPASRSVLTRLECHPTFGWSALQPQVHPSLGTCIRHKAMGQVHELEAMESRAVGTNRRAPCRQAASYIADGMRHLGACGVACVSRQLFQLRPNGIDHRHIGLQTAQIVLAR